MGASMVCDERGEDRCSGFLRHVPCQAGRLAQAALRRSPPFVCPISHILLSGLRQRAGGVITRTDAS